MLLRESSLHDGSEVDLSSIHGEALDHCGVANARLLVRFAEAAVERDAPALEAARQELLNTLGDQAVVDVAATVAIFTAVVRIADGTGIPLEPYKAKGTEDLREALELDEFASGRHV